VQDALSQATQLGVPAALADVSGPVNALTGSALRNSPEAMASARTALTQRSRGQIDRFTGAVERDLGPVTNIPQRSEDLIAQAKAAAGPLYEKAYAAPGAENVNLADLEERPTFSAALREAYNEVLDEGLDPSAVGLQGAGDKIKVASPSWQALDYVKRGLDNIIEKGTSKIDGVGPEARRAIAMKNTLLSRMGRREPRLHRRSGRLRRPGRRASGNGKRAGCDFAEPRSARGQRSQRHPGAGRSDAPRVPIRHCRQSSEYPRHGEPVGSHSCPSGHAGTASARSTRKTTSPGSCRSGILRDSLQPRTRN
jgi:hypothetical protein